MKYPYHKDLLQLDYWNTLTISRLIDFHLDRQLRRYSESSSDLIVPVQNKADTFRYRRSLSLCLSLLDNRDREIFPNAPSDTSALILPALEEVNIVEFAELEGELEGGL